MIFKYSKKVEKFHF